METAARLNWLTWQSTRSSLTRHLQCCFEVPRPLVLCCSLVTYGIKRRTDKEEKRKEKSHYCKVISSTRNVYCPITPWVTLWLESVSRDECLLLSSWPEMGEYVTNMCTYTAQLEVVVRSIGYRRSRKWMSFRYARQPWRSMEFRKNERMKVPEWYGESNEDKLDGQQKLAR